ncbi:hypothetical protein C8Z91_16390 [Paenibacillus elgii]|uniref:Uncharacterized protein n=1 Tax=Paenibacillus elgii TaxID=189691 RepID=A0A2T6G1E0_9BACL|nr:hypothetical protein C8Z91_16390 [Paenibacillus elgii]
MEALSGSYSRPRLLFCILFGMSSETEAAVEVKKRQSDGEWRHFAVMDLAGAAEPTLSVAGCLPGIDKLRWKR